MFSVTWDVSMGGTNTNYFDTLDEALRFANDVPRYDGMRLPFIQGVVGDLDGATFATSKEAALGRLRRAVDASIEREAKAFWGRRGK